MFIGRSRELEELNELYERPEFQMPVIYGRRRIGKSTLIQKFVEGKPAIVFTAIESSVEKNLELFSHSIYKALMPSMKSLPAFASFSDAFDFVTEYVKKERYVLVIDEYPYLAAADKSISSVLQSYIDGVWKDSRLYLILCGSSMSFMEKQVLGYQSPLYGRRTAQMKLLPLDYAASAQFVPDYSEEDRALVYGVTGGVPKYLELFRPELSVQDNIIRLFFQNTGYLFEEPENLLKQELREVASYNAVIEALAAGASKINEIVTKTHSDTSAVTYCLKTLISLGIVEKCTAMTEETNRKKTSYHICDHMFRFWYRFVPNGIDLIQLHQGEIYFQESVSEQLNDYMGSIFEDMCRHYLLWASAEGKLSFTITKIGRWWGTNPVSRQEEEIDIVGVNPTKKQALIGECKYRKQGIHLETAQKLLERGKLIGAYPQQSYVLCSLDYFTEDVRRFAEQNQILLITLKDLYA
jgi:hypothetical protein